MFNEMKNLAEGALANANPQQVASAAGDHVSGMSGEELGNHLQTAAGNLSSSGQGGLAQQVMDIVSQARTNPDNAKNEVVQLVRQNPQILSHFAPEFAQGVMSKIGL